jgi:hypothetical protein
MASDLIRMATDAELRDELAGRGPGRASLFTWERTARETLAVYSKAVD